MQGKRINVTRVTIGKIFKYGFSSVIFACALIIALVVINYVIAVKSLTFDVTKFKTNSLTQASLNLLKEINFNVNIKAFYPDSDQRRIRILLKRYSKRNKNIEVEFIDPIKKPLVAEEYDVSQPRTIIFESKIKQSRLNPISSGSRHTERNISIALYRLLTDQTNTVYFTTGHGELGILDTKPDGLSIIKEQLIEQNFIVENVNLLEEAKVPDDCSILVIAGPSVKFTDEEIVIIKDYLDNEGSIFLMLNPRVDANLDKIAKSHGIRFGNDYIYETSSEMTTSQYGGPIAPFCSAQDSSEITDNLPNQNFIFPFVRSINPVILTQSLKVNITRLLASSEHSWAETDLESVLPSNQKPRRDEDELKGPITVAVLTQREFELPDSLKSINRQSTIARSAFFGSSQFLKNSIVTPFDSNINLALNTFNWITSNENIIDVTPNISVFTPVELTRSERKTLTWLTLVIFPLSILMIGIVVWLQRR